MDECRDFAKLIQDLYDKTVAERDTAERHRDTYKPDTLEYGDWNRKYQVADDEISVICETWEAERKKCCTDCGMDIGDLCGRDRAKHKPSPKPDRHKEDKPKEPAVTSAKPPKGKLLSDAKIDRADAEYDDFLAGELVKRCKAFAIRGGGDVRVGGEGKASTGAVPGGELGGSVDVTVKGEKDLADACEPFFGTSLREKAAQLRREAGHLEAQAELDPPSTQYGELVEPDLHLVSIPAETTDLERVAALALEVEQCANAYLEAYGASYERYQGAQIAGDVAAMARQAQAMVEFAAKILEARRKAARFWYPFESFVRQALDWLPDESDPPPQLDEAQRRAMADWKARLDVTRELIEASAKRGGKVHTPEPKHVGTLLRLAVYARTLLSGAQRAQASGAGSAQQALDASDLRPGLLEALQRRAGFTRSHRGPLATPMDQGADSSDFPAAWYSAQLVGCAWHQDEHVWFAGFSPRGNVLHAPKPIGAGRSPRLASHEDNLAVAWMTDTGAAVRLRRGGDWSDIIVLAGREVSIAFGADGSLYAATTSGLFHLIGRTFVQMASTGFRQPALAVDTAGKPFVAHQRDGHVFCGDDNLGEGEQPSAAFDSDGALHVAYVSGGSLVLRTYQAGGWSPAQAIPVRGGSLPTLARGADGMRLTYLGPAEYGPTALWLLRLPDLTPTLMPSIAGNVIDAGVVVSFALGNTRSSYQPHDLWLSVNDQVVGRFTDTIPEGRYYFKLDPWLTFTSTGSPVPNRIAINSWHLNRGHYVVSTDYQIRTRTAWSEHFALASNPSEVLAAVKTLGLNHDQPDLALLANELVLPYRRPGSGQVELRVLVANLGEADSRPARLVMLSEDRFLGQSAVPVLKPGQQHPVTFALDANIELPDVVFRIYQESDDFDPSNDSMRVTLWGRLDRVPPAAERQPIAEEDPQTRRNAVIDAINQLATLVNAVISEINRLYEAIPREDYAAAETSLTQARDALARSTGPFAELGRRQVGHDYKSIYDLAARNREIQKELIGIADATTAQARAHDVAAFNLFIAKHNELIGSYNRNIDQIGEILNSTSFG